MQKILRGKTFERPVVAMIFVLLNRSYEQTTRFILWKEH